MKKTEEKKLVIGLGNPGPEYQKTRHNIGQRFLDYLATNLKNQDVATWKQNSKTNSLILTHQDFILAKPITFMNQSGPAVKKLLSCFLLRNGLDISSEKFRYSYYNTDPRNTLIIHDEVDLPLGKIKLSFGRGHAGHKGIKSIIIALKTKRFWRLRIGVGKEKQKPTERFVLENFKPSEEKKLALILDQSQAKVLKWIEL